MLLTGAMALAGPLRAQEVSLPEECRVANPPAGCCTWACLEAAGRLLGIDSLRGVTQDREARAREKIVTADGRLAPRNDAGGTPERVTQELALRNVNHEVRPAGRKDFRFLSRRLAAGVPVSLSLHGYPTFPDGTYDSDSWHAVLLLNLSESRARVWDPNEPEKILTVPRSFLNTYWTGRAVALVPTTPSPSGQGGVGGSPRGLVGIPPVSPEVRDTILQAIRQGRAACVTALRRELSLSQQEAEMAADRIWRR